MKKQREGTQRNIKLQRIVSMESPFETLGPHDDHAHSDATSHEKPLLPKRTQNLGLLPGMAYGD